MKDKKTKKYDLFGIFKKETDIKKVKSIAILARNNNDFTQQVVSNFRDTLQNAYKYPLNFHVYDAQEDKWALDGHIRHIMHNKYDMALTVGALCTQLLNEAYRYSSHKMPLPYCLVKK